MTVKSVIAEVKALGDGEKAEFEAYASVFGNRDSYGDVVQKGAFAASLKAWDEKGAPIPLLWGHNMADPDFNIGMVTSAEEDEHGLKVVCELDTDSPKGAQVHRLLKQGRVREMSFAFAATSSEYGELDGKSVRFLKEVDLFEVSVVPLGANPETEVLAVKSPTVNLTLPETLAERFLEVLGGKSLGGPPGTDEEDDDEDTPILRMSPRMRGFRHLRSLIAVARTSPARMPVNPMKTKRTRKAVRLTLTDSRPCSAPWGATNRKELST